MGLGGEKESFFLPLYINNFLFWARTETFTTFTIATYYVKPMSLKHLVFENHYRSAIRIAIAKEHNRDLIRFSYFQIGNERVIMVRQSSKGTAHHKIQTDRRVHEIPSLILSNEKYTRSFIILTSVSPTMHLCKVQNKQILLYPAFSNVS